MRPLAGVDGCRAGWVAVVREDGRTRVCVFARFAELLAALPGDAIVAVDMPIGLPEWIGPSGRGPEALARSVLGARRGSVFAIPSRRAVEAEPGPWGSAAERLAAHARVSAVARETSHPPRGVSIQAFGLFGKIREIDELMRNVPGLGGRVIESHPELAFWRLNGEHAMAWPKKLQGRTCVEGMSERREVLGRQGVSGEMLAGRFVGVGEDDLLDAAVLLLVAERFAEGMAVPMPDQPGRDAAGVEVAIWS